jgi:septal ring factor EnvC (AmiA/AmiB activator)
VKSETVIRNLEQEMEGYSGKVNELEEANYYLRKENEAVRAQLAKISEAKYELDEEIKCMEEDLAEMKEEVEFYKNKRRQELTKMLNDTDD